MKKTLIILLTLAGLSCAAETAGKTYIYTGGSDGWLEYNPNWVEIGTENKLSNDFNLTETQTSGNTFIVESGTTAKCGQNANFVKGTLEIERNASVTIQGSSKFIDSTINVASGASLAISASITLSGGELNVHGSDINITVQDVKMMDFTLNVLSGNVGFKKTWFDNGSDSTGIAINLGEGASVSFSESVLKANWDTAITLSAALTKGYVQNGTGDVILGESVLIDFGTRNASSDAFLSDYLNSGYFVGNSIKANGSTLAADSFDADALTEEDVGKYQFVIDGSKLKVQYVAYSQSIPEPTTATLSLLALAGLAARRRRR